MSAGVPPGVKVKLTELADVLDMKSEVKRGMTSDIWSVSLDISF